MSSQLPDEWEDEPHATPGDDRDPPSGEWDSADQPVADRSDRLQLTPRETEVMQSIAIGLSNRAIGRALGISERTVKVHIRSIFIKMNVSSRTQAAVVALQNGHISLPEPNPDPDPDPGTTRPL
ncbi:response regulator transcription factor [Streptomyces sp. NPDC048644]|uniref:response regulator transcription factor n=1 Tax=Streptomyces sp. NPDC048644 TaxID=3365582 RepID=UPI0037127902